MIEPDFRSPWRIIDVGYGLRIEPDVCWIGDSSEVSKDQQKAIACLIKAAPAMYEALKEIAAMEPGEYETEVEYDHPTMMACDTCREMREIASEVLKEIAVEQ